MSIEDYKQAYQTEKAARQQAEQVGHENLQKLLHAQLELKRLSQQDILTQLTNRLHFEEILARVSARAVQQQTLFALLFIDIDFFKTINESYGHEIGDLLLQEMGVRLRVSLNDDDNAARLSGDEFAVILAQVTRKEQVIAYASALLESLAQHYQIGEHAISSSVSIGIACFPEAGSTPAELKKNADIALSRAKQAGRNNYQMFNSEESQTHTLQADVESALHFAIEREEINLVYQPKFDLATNKIVGFEVLSRWNHPQHGAISPTFFIPLAEKTGLIVNLGNWVLRTACQQYMQWLPASKQALPIAVNVSPLQLRQLNFVDSVKEALAITQLPPHLLELELTEMSGVTDFEAAKTILNQLHALGIKLSIDDFGTGYSNLTLLRQLPVQTIKLDKSFINEVPDNASDAQIVEATLTLAHNLQLTIVAEGVETLAQHEFLKARGCTQAQGHYYSKPLDQHAMAELLAAN